MSTRVADPLAMQHGLNGRRPSLHSQAMSRRPRAAGAADNAFTKARLIEEQRVDVTTPRGSNMTKYGTRPTSSGSARARMAEAVGAGSRMTGSV